MHLGEHASVRGRARIPVLLLLIGGFYALVAFLLRYPFVDVITDPVGLGAIYDPMEAIYLLLARDVVAGHLPYQHYWADLSPFGWLVTVPYWMIGGGVIGARVLVGVTTVAVAMLLQRTGSEMGRGFMGWLAGIFYILATALLPLSHSFGVSVFGALLVVLLMRMVFSPQVSVHGFACMGAALVMLHLEGILVVAALLWCAGRRGANARALMMRMLLVLACANAVLFGCAWLVGVQDVWLASFTVRTMPAFFAQYWLDRDHIVWVMLIAVYLIFALEALIKRKLEKLDASLSAMLAAGLAAVVLEGLDVEHMLRCVMLYMPVFAIVMARVMMLEMRDLRPLFMMMTLVGIWHASTLVREAYAARIDSDESIRGKEVFSERTIRIAEILRGKITADDELVDCSGASMLHVLTGAQYSGYVMMPVGEDIRRIEEMLKRREAALVISHNQVKAVVAGERDLCLMRAAGELKAHYELLERIYGSAIYLRKEEAGAEAPEQFTE